MRRRGRRCRQVSFTGAIMCEHVFRVAGPAFTPAGDILNGRMGPSIPSQRLIASVVLMPWGQGCLWLSAHHVLQASHEARVAEMQAQLEAAQAAAEAKDAQVAEASAVSEQLKQQLQEAESCAAGLEATLGMSPCTASHACLSAAAEQCRASQMSKYCRTKAVQSSRASHCRSGTAGALMCQTFACFVHEEA